MRTLQSLAIVLIGILSCSSPVPNDSNDSSLNSLVRINKPPTILSLTADRDTVGVSDEVRFTCRAEDPDGDSLTYAWFAAKTKEDGSVDVTYHSFFGFDTTQFVKHGKQATWLVPRWPGTYKVFCKVVDKAGYEEIAEIPIGVSIADRIYFITDKYRYRINGATTFTVGNDQYPLIWIEGCFFSFIIERFENGDWEYVSGGICQWLFNPIPLEYQEIITWTDHYGFTEAGMYRFKYEIRIDEQYEVKYLISNTFVVE